MTTQRVIVFSSDGVKFSTELFARSDAQLAAAWEQELAFAASKSAAYLINHGDFTLHSDQLHVEEPVPVKVTVGMGETRSWSGGPAQLQNLPRGKPQLRLIQGGKA